jgi:hypothetical protein
MNKIIGYIGLASVLMTVAISIATTKGSYDDAYEIYRYVSTDTITNTESDTILLTANLFSFFKSNHTVNVDSLSGTTDLDVTVQETNNIDGGEWYTVATDSIATNGSTLSMTSDVYGIRRRVIITGVGTQSTKYVLRSVMKKDYN